MSASSLFVTIVLLSLVAIVSAACINDCSQHGKCTPANTCFCEPGFLSVDCSVQSNMRPLELIGGNYTTYWAIVNDMFYHRIIARIPSAGWAGVLFGAVDRMTNGRGHVVTVPNAFNGTVYDVFATAYHKPNSTTSIVLGAVGINDDTHVDVSYYRPTSSSVDHHYSIPTVPGTITNMSVATSNAFFEFHGHSADYMKVDLAKMALGEATSVTE